MLKSLMFSNKLFSIIFISLILEIATSVISPNPAMSQLTLSQQTIENQENNPDDISDFNNFRPWHNETKTF